MKNQGNQFRIEGYFSLDKGIKYFNTDLLKDRPKWGLEPPWVQFIYIYIYIF